MPFCFSWKSLSFQITQHFTTNLSNIDFNLKRLSASVNSVKHFCPCEICTIGRTMYAMIDLIDPNWNINNHSFFYFSLSLALCMQNMFNNGSNIAWYSEAHTNIFYAQQCSGHCFDFKKSISPFVKMKTLIFNLVKKIEEILKETSGSSSNIGLI